MRPWNTEVEQREFWDPNLDDGKGRVVPKLSTLKARLQDPSGMQFEELLRDVAHGLAMVMNEIEKNDPKEVDISGMDQDEEEQ